MMKARFILGMDAAVAFSVLQARYEPGRKLPRRRCLVLRPTRRGQTSACRRSRKHATCQVEGINGAPSVRGYVLRDPGVGLLHFRPRPANGDGRVDMRPYLRMASKSTAKMDKPFEGKANLIPRWLSAPAVRGWASI